MNLNNILLCLIGTSIYLFPSVFGRKAIVGGYVAVPPDLNYYVSIDIAGHISQCGGGIVNNNTVITAASCLFKRDGRLFSKNISVLANTYVLRIGMTVAVETIYIPKEYTAILNDSVGDIAVLKLKRPLDTKIYDLTELSVARSASYSNKLIVVSGFGWNMMNNNNVGGHSDYQLRYAYVEIHDDEQCQDDHLDIQITKNRFCARVKQGPHHSAHQRRGVCHGDVGGPLVLNGKIIAGILSIIARDCSEVASSAIYTRIGHYRNFILNSLKNVVTRNMLVIRF